MSNNVTEELIEHLIRTKIYTVKTLKALRAVTKNYYNNNGVESKIENDSTEQKELYKLFYMLIDRNSAIELKVRTTCIKKTQKKIEQNTGWSFYDNEIRYDVDSQSNEEIPLKNHIILYKRSGFYVPQLEESQKNNNHLVNIYNESIEFLNENDKELWSVSKSKNIITDIMNGKYELSDFCKRIKDSELPILIAQRLGFPGIPQNYTFQEIKNDFFKWKKIINIRKRW